MSYAYSPLEDGECSVTVYYANFEADAEVINLPCYPEEVSNSVEASWSEQTIIGRTGTINVFTGTSDITTSFSFDLHREMYPAHESLRGNYVDRIVRIIKAGCYPRYTAGSLQPPYVIWKFGDMTISGRLKSVSDTWKKPIIAGSYTVCTLSITMAGAAKGIVGAEDI